MNASILQYKQKNEAVRSKKKSQDLFAEFYRQKEEKYKDILILEPAGRDLVVLDKIDQRVLTQKQLDRYLSKISLQDEKAGVIHDIRSVIADQIGDMLETYRYESIEEGQTIEDYIDQLLSVVNRHEMSTPGMLSAALSSSNKASVKPIRDTLFL
jgi:hypothetical protein